MLTPTRGLPFENAGAPLRAVSFKPLTQPESTSSFAQQLADSLESFLTDSPDATRFEVNISPRDGSDSGVRQFLVTVTPAAAAVPAAPAAPAADPGSVLDVTGMLMYSGTAPAASEVQEAPAAPVFTDQADAYWAMHPPEVQALRSIQDPGERGQMGQELANRGFSIDNEIMILGWDPYMTMKVRQESGYTWFPAIGQWMTPVAPGISFPGLPSYDPNNAPQGSIRVSTDFAIGLEHTSPCGIHLKPSGVTPAQGAQS